ncbi:peptide deformylase [Lichenicola cladoniae]|uniref:Peptide deformylase n=1 Tax=Lichenicola cladoniae TaxID=1484109 RepID=A0A6M8HQE6_9PROT|nr:peptide deformylase [Lichenicola cladoniae]NPD67983.1 peptide deformylase [Acetobacteraceae bacterium]QKE90572.1 peptide deformylase [Lichenicola cladoniae]
MALLKIARMGHPVLLGRATPVQDPTSPAIRQLIEDMIETMEDASGAGLAAPQVHIPLRLFIYTVPEARSSEGDPPRAADALINPVLTPIGDEIAVRTEGCLSIPGWRGAVPRHARVRYEGLDRHGEPVSGEATGFLALVLQHENDHLDGILYPMRMTDLRLLGFEQEMARYGLGVGS